MPLLSVNHSCIVVHSGNKETEDDNESPPFSNLWILLSARQMPDTHRITTPETAPVRCSVGAFKTGMPVFITVLDIERTMVLCIFASAFNTVEESLPFYALQLPRWYCPSLSISRGRWPR